MVSEVYTQSASRPVQVPSARSQLDKKPGDGWWPDALTDDPHPRPFKLEDSTHDLQPIKLATDTEYRSRDVRPIVLHTYIRRR